MTTRSTNLAFAGVILLMITVNGFSFQRPNGSSRRSQMVRIRGTTFQMGTDQAEIEHLQQIFNVKRAELFSAEVPRHQVTLTQFYLDTYEVTNAQFKRFLDRNPDWRRDRIAPKLHNGNYLIDWNDRTFPNGKFQHPVVNVSWYAAVAYCQWSGKRLPTEAEWEWAASGGSSGRAYPWGNDPVDPKRANYAGSKFGTTTPVGSYPANGYGLHDMAGNVWEFLADEWGPYGAAAQTNPVAGGNFIVDRNYLTVISRRVIRGGSWGGGPINLRVTYRDSHPPEGAKDFVGFRCARSILSKSSN
ncbi:MAG: formylglycine-generating enzyme family protein [Pyrinomonadaceae bacterium]